MEGLSFGAACVQGGIWMERCVESGCCVNCVCEERIMWRMGRAVESL
ncbi:hypothetical protein COLO4_38424 [Corchorus olitorius]|uniref:Uncharacterized protein n=1 Tax=Corchorus olitorius TaxID=93759 RepID=A0A1R3FVG7_9ROSI|nr:hypothetical protein COLO4_38424 [Corchorus olitorius]